MVGDEDEIEDYLVPPNAFEGQVNGICGASLLSKLFFVTGMQNGVIRIQVELHKLGKSIIMNTNNLSVYLIVIVLLTVLCPIELLAKNNKTLEH